MRDPARLAPKNAYAVGQYGVVSYLAGDRTTARTQLAQAVQCIVQIERLGVRTRIGFRPSVETQIYLDASYGWLGESRALFADGQWSVGVGARYRIAPGWTADGFVRHYQRRGTVPAAVLGGTAFGYRTQGTEGGAALTHLLHVFEDGRAWFQTLAASYADDTILDYGAVGAGRGALVKGRQVWRVDWDHTVQLSAQGRLRFGVGYHHERIGPGGTSSRTDAWTGRLRYTYRFD